MFQPDKYDDEDNLGHSEDNGDDNDGNGIGTMMTLLTCRSYTQPLFDRIIGLQR